MSVLVSLKAPRDRGSSLIDETAFQQHFVEAVRAVASDLDLNLPNDFWAPSVNTTTQKEIALPRGPALTKLDEEFDVAVDGQVMSGALRLTVYPKTREQYPLTV